MVNQNSINGPILRAKDVTDYGNVNFIADPFFCEFNDKIHLFFEVYNRDEKPTASIGHASTTDGGNTWEYDQIVLNIGKHISFPYVFKHCEEVYILPDISNTPNRISPSRLYKFDNFPTSCEPVVDIIDRDHKCLDTVVFKHDERWWAILGSGDNDELRVYHSDELTASDWIPHPANPVVEDRKSAGRPGGRPIVHNGDIIMFYQDCTKIYGNKLRAYKIDELSTTTFNDTPLFNDKPLLSGEGHVGWNSGRMHHLDILCNESGALVATDGDIGLGRAISKPMWSIGIESFKF